MLIKDKETGAISEKTTKLEKDEGNRPETNTEGLANLIPVRGEENFITAGNASQLSDGASACVVMNSKLAEQRNKTEKYNYPVRRMVWELFVHDAAHQLRACARPCFCARFCARKVIIRRMASKKRLSQAAKSVVN